MKTTASLFAILLLGVAAATAAFGQHGAPLAPPANDNFANAESLVGINVSVTRTNVEATKETGEPNHANNVGGKSVWFRWTAPMTRTMRFTTNTSTTNFDTIMHIYQGTVLTSLSTRRSSNDVSAPVNRKSHGLIQATAGQTYYVAVDGTNLGSGAAEGTFSLSIQPAFTPQGADYDYDGMTDMAFYRPSNGTWNYVSSATGQTITTQWGIDTDIPSPIILQGNGQDDISVFRPSDGIWYHQTCCQELYVRWGTNGDIPVPAQYGNSIGSELAVFRPSTGIWYLLLSASDTRYYHFGQAGDIPVPGHYSPDGNADIAVFRPSTGVWYFVNRISGQPASDTFSSVRFGISGDKPVPADYDGDGILDVAVYRPSTGVWWVLRSSDGQGMAFQWGIAEDIPTTGDFDGDGRSDYAVFRPSNGTWYVLGSGGQVQLRQFGQSGDIPVTATKTF